ncbi:MAG: 30S ribosomal protein S16 [Acidimicrobiia bacterium]
MSVKIRLMRMGKKKQPTYRVVVADGRSPRDGRYIEILGQYRPREEPSHFAVDDEKVLGWLHQGAQPTDQVHRLLVNAGIWERYETDRKRQSRAARTAAAKAKGAAAAKTERDAAKAAADAEAKAAADAAASEKASEDAAAAEAAAAEEAPAEEAAASDEAAE